MIYILIMIVIFLLIWYCRDIAETYRSCRDCDNLHVPVNGILVSNPFIWPSSGASSVDDLYILGKDTGADIGTDVGPLTHLSAPDHVLLTN